MLLCSEDTESVVEDDAEEDLLRYIFSEKRGEEEPSHSVGRWVSVSLLVFPASVSAEAPSLQSLTWVSLCILSVQGTEGKSVSISYNLIIWLLDWEFKDHYPRMHLIKNTEDLGLTHKGKCFNWSDLLTNLDKSCWCNMKQHNTVSTEILWGDRNCKLSALVVCSELCWLCKVSAICKIGYEKKETLLCSLYCYWLLWLLCFIRQIVTGQMRYDLKPETPQRNSRQKDSTCFRAL